MLDFGHAQGEKRAVSIRGTERFVAPEVRLWDKVNTRASDAYSGHPAFPEQYSCF